MIHATEVSALYIGQSGKDRHVATVMNMSLTATKPRRSTSLQCPRTETTPPTVARTPDHVATTPKVPTPCLYSTNHDPTR
jgi:hypothetical protein